MLIQIDVPKKTYCLSVTVMYHNGDQDTVTSRVFVVNESGKVADETGGRAVVVRMEGKDAT